MGALDIFVNSCGFGDIEIGVRFKYRDDCISNRMKLVRSIWQSCDIIVGMATDELDLERNGKVNGMGPLYTGSVLKCGVW